MKLYCNVRWNECTINIYLFLTSLTRLKYDGKYCNTAEIKCWPLTVWKVKTVLTAVMCFLHSDFAFISYFLIGINHGWSLYNLLWDKSGWTKYCNGACFCYSESRMLGHPADRDCIMETAYLLMTFTPKLSTIRKWTSECNEQVSLLILVQFHWSAKVKCYLWKDYLVQAFIDK